MNFETPSSTGFVLNRIFMKSSQYQGKRLGHSLRSFLAEHTIKRKLIQEKQNDKVTQTTNIRAVMQSNICTDVPRHVYLYPPIRLS